MTTAMMTQSEKAIQALTDAGFSAHYNWANGRVVVQAFTQDLETAGEFNISTDERDHWAGIYDANQQSND